MEGVGKCSWGREMLQWWADLVDAQIEEGRKVVVARFGKAFQAA